MNIYEHAKQEGITMVESARRGGRKSGRERRAKRTLREEFEKLQENKGDYWNK